MKIATKKTFKTGSIRHCDSRSYANYSSITPGRRNFTGLFPKPDML